jgi:CxxC-x17-CxxC domain-containing protein
MGFSNKLLNCVDCRKVFIFSIEEQEYHASRGFPNVPNRCPFCRRIKKTGVINNNGFDADFSPGNQMPPVTCIRCGKTTRLTFQPRKNEANYCSDCYAKNKIG